MPLSEHEQRLLDQIERELYAEDPKFASTVRGTRVHRPSRRRRVQGFALVLTGLALLVLGVVLPASFLRIAEIPWMSVLGFVVMFFGALVAVAAIRSSGDSEEGDAETSGGGAGKRGGTSGRRSGFAQRMENRFRQRFEDH